MWTSLTTATLCRYGQWTRSVLLSLVLAGFANDTSSGNLEGNLHGGCATYLISIQVHLFCMIFWDPDGHFKIPSACADAHHSHSWPSLRAIWVCPNPSIWFITPPATMYMCSPSLLYNVYLNHLPQWDTFVNHEHNSIRGHAWFWPCKAL